MTDEHAHWTSGEIETLRGLAAAGRSAAEIAPRLGRTEAAVRAQLEREPPITAPPLEWNGPDEEGDVRPPTGRIDDDDPSAWVHSAPHEAPPPKKDPQATD